MSGTAYIGQTVLLQAVPTDPFTGAVLTTLSGMVGFYAPPKNPRLVPADRVYDVAPVLMTFDTVRQAYTVLVDTSAPIWISRGAGKWAYRVTFTGVYTVWEYGLLTLKV